MRKNGAAHINVRIEHMVLECAPLSRAQAAQLQNSVERELTSLLRTRGLPARGRAEESLAAPARGISSGRPSGEASQTPAQLGREIARSIYECLNPAV